MQNCACYSRLIKGNFRNLAVTRSRQLRVDVGKTNSNEDSTKKVSEVKMSGLAKALGKFREFDAIEQNTKKESEPPQTFLNLLRNSKFVQLGDLRGKLVIGKIFKVVNTDLYIDFGAKFYCVCRRPLRNAEQYVRGAKVRLRINEVELCARFLGAVEDLTLLEADATLVGLLWSPFGKDVQQQKPNT